MQPFQTYKTHPLTPGQQRAFQQLGAEAQRTIEVAQARAEGLMQGYMKGVGIEHGLEDGAWSLSPDGTMLMHPTDSMSGITPVQDPPKPSPPPPAPPTPAPAPEPPPKPNWRDMKPIDVKPNGRAE